MKLPRASQYTQAQKVRESSLSGNIADKIIGGGSIGGAISKSIGEKMSAKVTGIKESFDPLNIASAMTGRSKLGTAIAGKILGRSGEDMSYFANKGKKSSLKTEKTSKKRGVLSGLFGGGESNDSLVAVASKVYDIMHKTYEDDKLYEETQRNLQRAKADKKNAHNNELIDALLGQGKFKMEKPAPSELKVKESAKKPEVKETPKSTKEGAPAEAKPAAPEAAPKPAEAPAKVPTEAPAKVPAKEPAPKPKAEKVTEKPAVQKEAPKAAAAPTPPAAPAPAPTPPAPAVPKPTVPTPAPTSKIPTIPAGAATGTKGLVVGALAAAGLSQKAQANIMAQVEAESNFKPRSENLSYTSAERIQNIFGKRRIPTLEFAQQFVGKPEELANHVYAKTDGNSSPGDGWKYRGRGYLQHTGKNQYIAIAKYTGINVVDNPDLLNTPEVAAKAVAWFFLEYKKKKPEQLENISEVNKAVGFAGGAKEASHREELVAKYSKESLVPSSANSGESLAKQSTDNTDMKKDMQQRQGSVQVNNTTNVLPINQSGGTTMVQPSDDSSKTVNRAKRQ
jgi:putative chitinase